MKDRFKFRVWDIKEENFIEELDIVRLTQYGNFVFNNTENNIEPLLNPNRFIFEQCTGLKDKNGKLIYEGDIISRKGMYRRVFWLDDEGGFGYEPSTLFESLQTKTCKIVGNIHENGDLLNGCLDIL